MISNVYESNVLLLLQEGNSVKCMMEQMELCMSESHKDPTSFEAEWTSERLDEIEITKGQVCVLLR